jgi:hypothetical protein
MRIIKHFALIFRILVFISAVSFCLLSFFYLPSYFSKTERVKSDILVVEGWISEDAIVQAYDEFINGNYRLIITTGGPMPDDFEMFYDGKLVFEFNSEIPKNINKISVNAFSDNAGGSSAHMKIAVNDSIVGETYTTTDLRLYEFDLKSPLRQVRKVSVIFDNDYFISPIEDRNLHIRSIVIGSKEIIARNDTTYFCKGLDSDSTESVAYSSQAITAQIALKKLGIRDSQIISVPAPKVNIYRTKNNARALLNWLNKENVHISSFNVFSEGIHSRRSWIIYKNMFGSKYKIGIIAAYEAGFNEIHWWHSAHNIKHLLKELTGNIYFRIIRR